MSSGYNALTPPRTTSGGDDVRVPQDEPFQSAALECLPALHRWAWHLCRCAEEAEDLVQETYARAFAAAHQYDPTTGPVRPWLFAIAYRQFLRRCERRRREEAAWRFLASEHLRSVRSRTRQQPTGDGPDDEQIRVVIAALPRTQREVVTLWAMEGMKYREIAEVLGLPLGTVMSRLHRARERLQLQLGTAQGVRVPQAHPFAPIAMGLPGEHAGSSFAE